MRRHKMLKNEERNWFSLYSEVFLATKKQLPITLIIARQVYSLTR